MLCRRSASLIRITRRSLAIASSILRKFSAWASSVGLELDLVELGDPVHQLRRGSPEALGDLGPGDVGVLHHVVEEGGAQGLGVQVPAGEDLATATGWEM